MAVGVAALGLLGVGAMAAKSPVPKPRPAKVTYAENVAPILNRSCVSCHRPNEVAPFSLIGYDNAKKWSKMISVVTEGQQMPPWKATHGYGDFQDENLLSKDEIQLLADWNAAGAPRGDAKKEPKTPSFPASEWSQGKPDLILSPSSDYKLAADGEDVYRNFILKADWKEPIWVKAMEVKPGNRKVVHHVIAFLDKQGRAQKLAAEEKDGQEGYTSSGGGVGFLPSGSLGGWAPGQTTRLAPQGTAFKVEPGEEIVLQVHYHKSGKEETDRTRIGLYLAKEPIIKEMDLNWIFNFQINIPPGDANHAERRVYTYPKDVTIYGAMPHMHLLGKQMKSWLEFPDGTTKPLVEIKKWDFNWQLTYAFKEPIKVPAGTKQIVEAVYDNSNDNVNNPNTPPRRVHFGEETSDEMFLLIVPYTVD